MGPAGAGLIGTAMEIQVPVVAAQLIATELERRPARSWLRRGRWSTLAFHSAVWPVPARLGGSAASEQTVEHQLIAVEPARVTVAAVRSRRRCPPVARAVGPERSRLIDPGEEGDTGHDAAVHPVAAADVERDVHLARAAGRVDHVVDGVVAVSDGPPSSGTRS